MPAYFNFILQIWAIGKGGCLILVHEIEFLPITDIPHAHSWFLPHDTLSFVLLDNMWLREWQDHNAENSTWMIIYEHNVSHSWNPFFRATRIGWRKRRSSYCKFSKWIITNRWCRYSHSKTVYPTWPSFYIRLHKSLVFRNKWINDKITMPQIFKMNEFQCSTSTEEHTVFLSLFTKIHKVLWAYQITQVM